MRAGRVRPGADDHRASGKLHYGTTDEYITVEHVHGLDYEYDDEAHVLHHLDNGAVIEALAPRDGLAVADQRDG